MGVNRDINNTQTITRDETHGGVDVRLNVDNDMVANPGEYVQAVKDMPKNLKGAGRHVGNITKAHYMDITNDSDIALSRENPDGSSTFTEADTYIANNGDYTVGELSASREQSERSQALSIYTPGTDLFGTGQSYDIALAQSMAEIQGKEPVIIEWGDNRGDGRASGEDLARQINDMNLSDNQEPVVINYWGGDNEVVARQVAGEEMSAFVESYEFRDGETLDNAAHSHGGNVVNEFTQAYDGDKKLDRTVYLGTPQRPDHRFDWSDTNSDSQTINLYDTGDVVQSHGGDGLLKKAGREMPGATNVPIYQTERVRTEIGGTDPDDVFPPMTIEQNVHMGPIDSHRNLDSAEVWNEYVKPRLERPKAAE